MLSDVVRRVHKILWSQLSRAPLNVIQYEVSWNIKPVSDHF